MQLFVITSKDFFTNVIANVKFLYIHMYVPLVGVAPASIGVFLQHVNIWQLHTPDMVHLKLSFI